MAQNKFKTGDRVYWNGGEFCDSDSGVVMPDNSKEWYLEPDYVWVKWDSDGAIEYISESKIDFESNKVKAELTVQSCLDFLIAQGYSITLKKE